MPTSHAEFYRGAEVAGAALAACGEAAPAARAAAVHAALAPWLAPAGDAPCPGSGSGSGSDYASDSGSCSGSDAGVAAGGHATATDPADDPDAAPTAPPPRACSTRALPVLAGSTPVRPTGASPNGASPTRACTVGCDACCHFPVGVTFGEGTRLVGAVRARPELVARVRAAADATHRRAWSDLVGLPCPLLDAGRCAVYDARPLPCRALASTDADACRRALAGTELVGVPVDRAAWWRGLGAAATLGAHSPSGTRELRSVLAALLALDPACAGPRNGADVAVGAGSGAPVGGRTIGGVRPAARDAAAHAFLGAREPHGAPEPAGEQDRS